jgi:hypothetical protein
LTRTCAAAVIKTSVADRVFLSHQPPDRGTRNSAATSRPPIHQRTKTHTHTYMYYINTFLLNIFTILIYSINFFVSLIVGNDSPLDDKIFFDRKCF